MSATRRWRVVLAAGACAWLLVAPGAHAAERATECEGEAIQITPSTAIPLERTLLCLVNVHRAGSGLPALTHDERLRRAARKHSAYMDQVGQLEHAGIGDGDPTSRGNDEGYPYGSGENIAWTNFPGYSPREMFELWRGSPGHNANMLGDFYETSGMGFALGSHGVIGTQMFGTTNDGATDTAADLLTSPACRAADAAKAAAERRVAKKRERVRRAESKRARRKAKRRLKRARGALEEAASQVESACDLVY